VREIPRLADMDHSSVRWRHMATGQKAIGIAFHGQRRQVRVAALRGKRDAGLRKSYIYGMSEHHLIVKSASAFARRFASNIGLHGEWWKEPRP